MSKFFDLDEMACHDGTAYPSEWAQTRWAKLAATLDAIREAWGGPIRIVSGYRTPEYNANIKGAKKSQHVEGMAADIRPVFGQVAAAPRVTVKMLYDLIIKLRADGKLPDLGGVGYYSAKWVHVDVREGSHLATWVGAGIGSEQT